MTDHTCTNQPQIWREVSGQQDHHLQGEAVWVSCRGCSQLVKCIQQTRTYDTTNKFYGEWAVSVLSKGWCSNPIGN